MEKWPGQVPTRGEVLVKVHATAVMPTELQWGLTFTQKSGQPRMFPIVLSHEFAGVIEEVGPNVDTVGVGEAVYGLNDWFSNGGAGGILYRAASAGGRASHGRWMMCMRLWLRFGR